VEKAETVPLHFTLELKDLRDRGSLNGSNLHGMSPTWHAMDNVPWSAGFCTMSHLKKVVLAQNWETMSLQISTLKGPHE
jgi:hypothetical protein